MPSRTVRALWLCAILTLSGCGASPFGDQAQAPTTTVTSAAPAAPTKEQLRSECVDATIAATTRAYREGAGANDLRRFGESDVAKRCEAAFKDDAIAAAGIGAEVLRRLPSDVRQQVSAESEAGRAAAEKFGEISRFLQQG